MDAIHHPPQLVRRSEAAAMLGIGRRTLSRLVSNGRISKVVISSRASRISLAEIQRFIAESKAKGHAP
ncbi:helix-turn-helix domain-containing protein [Diaphorobacter sp. HDW4A]|uniref:helix-turn-helix transcriptional regulator n=1 Tax=Diaphorobacter sp. HDW4A TaxID=2714924 RepID=UPI00140CFD8E|nr:helix-turn-helix domain-containing protein [Diaphorobacter sp. HDW4A]